MATSIFVENYREKYEKILKEELLETLVDVTPPQAKKLIDIEDEFRRYHPASGGKIDHLANPADFDKYIGASAGQNAINSEDLEHFRANGGNVLFAPEYDYVKYEDQTVFKLRIQASDFVVPICHEGMNRSQVLYLVLHGLLRDVPIPRVCAPHGADTGFDPTRAYQDDINIDTWYKFVHGVMLPRGQGGDWLHSVFYETFGVEKHDRVGKALNIELGDRLLNATFKEKQGSTLPLNLPDDTPFQELAFCRRVQRLAMERSLYDVKVLRSYTGTEGRVILFCFCRAASIILSRLLEANPSGSSFKNIYIVAMPWPDQISGAGGRDDIEAYRKRTGKTLTRDQLNAMCLRETYYHFRNCLWLDGVAESTPDESSAFRAAGGAVESK